MLTKMKTKVRIVLGCNLSQFSVYFYLFDIYC